MTEAMEYQFKAVDEKEVRTYRKGSKYDPMLDSFIAGDNPLVIVTTEKDPNYLRTQLNKRIDARKLESVKVSVQNNNCYLEKI